jgi:hypothetical protein
VYVCTTTRYYECTRRAYREVLYVASTPYVGG